MFCGTTEDPQEPAAPASSAFFGAADSSARSSRRLGALLPPQSHRRSRTRVKTQRLGRGGSNVSDRRKGAGTVHDSC